MDDDKEWPSSEWFLDWCNRLTIAVPPVYEDDVAQEAIIEAFIWDAEQVFRILGPDAWFRLTVRRPEGL
jgi:hypothetical protein